MIKLLFKATLRTAWFEFVAALVQAFSYLRGRLPLRCRFGAMFAARRYAYVAFCYALVFRVWE